MNNQRRGYARAFPSQERNPVKHLTIFDLRAEIEQILDEIVDAEIAGNTDAVEALHAELDKLYDARSKKH